MEEQQGGGLQESTPVHLCSGEADAQWQQRRMGEGWRKQEMVVP